MESIIINNSSRSSSSGAEQKRRKGKVDQGKIINNKEFRRHKNPETSKTLTQAEQKEEEEGGVLFQINSD